MALFFKTDPAPEVKKAISQALKSQPPANAAATDELATSILASAQPDFKSTLIAALNRQPPSESDEEHVTDQLAKQVPAGGAAGQTIAWDRIILAAVFLGVIFGASIYTAHDEKMHDFSKPLLTTFTTLLTATAGL